jgi:hypothetical protein
MKGKKLTPNINIFPGNWTAGSCVDELDINLQWDARLVLNNVGPNALAGHICNSP